MGLAKSEFKATRMTVRAETIHLAFSKVSRAMEHALAEKGDGAFVSIGEIRGYLDEEVDEVHAEQHRNDEGAFARELVDVAVAAIFGVASMETWKHKPNPEVRDGRASTGPLGRAQRGGKEVQGGRLELPTRGPRSAERAGG